MEIRIMSGRLNEYSGHGYFQSDSIKCKKDLKRTIFKLVYLKNDI